MKCDYCEKKAAVFLTQLAEGQMKKVCLCDDCAKERGVTDPTGFSLADMLLGNFQNAVGTAAKVQGKERTGAGAAGGSCPECGFSLEEFQKVRRFGCGNCYSVFSGELGTMLQGMHKGPTHVGKVPEGLLETHFRQQKLDELASKLEQAVEAENYEAAADLRDEIRTLEEVPK
ncbi:MAG: UvrB/UvrC motif-containing protein [Luteolibacter sp.]